MEILDLDFLGLHETIPVYMFPHKDGVALIECGPGSTLPVLEAKLKEKGYKLSDVTDVFLTHIHLDHAGAAGAMARHGAKIHLHPNGAAHMINPEKLLASAARIYGDKMDHLWGEFLAVPDDKISILDDGQEVTVNALRFVALHTPGHANHHIAYLYEDVCFSGDVGGVRMQGQKYISMPTPPPEFHLETWHETIEKLRKVGFKYIAPTHYGLFDDVAWHLDTLHKNLDEIEVFMQRVMETTPTFEEVHSKYITWSEKQLNENAPTDGMRGAYEAASPAWMSPAGLYRYWKKYRIPE